MKTFFLKLFAFTMTATLTSCAAMQQDYENRMCNYDGAYEAGANAARERSAMNGSGIASQCPAQARDAVMSGYRAGFASVPPTPIIQPAPIVIVQPPPPTPIRVNPTYPGYPRQGGGGMGTYIPPAQQCIESYGRKVCGYGCKESYGNIRCAREPRHSCMESYGKIYCGLNCREDGGRVVCDETER